VKKWTAELRRRAKMDAAKMDGGVTPPCKNGHSIPTSQGGEVTIILLYLGGPFSTAGVLNGRRPNHNFV
jgi:hypothetical protein